MKLYCYLSAHKQYTTPQNKSQAFFAKKNKKIFVNFCGKIVDKAKKVCYNQLR